MQYIGWISGHNKRRGKIFCGGGVRTHRHKDAAIDDVVGQEGMLLAELVRLGEAGGSACAGPVLGLGQRVVCGVVPGDQGLANSPEHCTHTQTRSAFHSVPQHTSCRLRTPPL